MRSSWRSCAWPSPHCMEPQTAALHLPPPGSWLQVSSPGLCTTGGPEPSQSHFISTFPLSHRLGCPQDLPPHEVSMPSAQLSTHPPTSLPPSHQHALVLWPAEPSGRKESYQGPHPWATSCQGSAGEVRHTVLCGSFKPRPGK